MKKLLLTIKESVLILATGLLTQATFAQTNVFDDVIATSSAHTSLTIAINTAGLAPLLRSQDSTYTVFAPDNAAFDQLAVDLNTNIAGLLALPNLANILAYHVLGITVNAGAVTNGAIVTPLNNANTLKLTKTSINDVFVNQAQVNIPDLSANNGVVHSVNSVLLPFETVVDIAIDNNFSSLVAAVVKAELLPALTNPFDTITVFAPNNDAFDSLASAFNTNIAGLLYFPNLQNILLYHVLAGNVASGDLSNGLIADALNTDRTLKITITSASKVFVNHSEVLATDIIANNGTVHVLKEVILPAETVVDVALDNGFSTLAAALIRAELIPVLSNPFQEFTVFAPTNDAFDTFAKKNSLTLAQILALPNLADVLTYHVVAGTVLSTDLANGLVPTLNTRNIKVNIDNGVKINFSTVTTADVNADNGVVHIIDAVLDENALNIRNINLLNINLFPNPSSDLIYTVGLNNFDYSILNIQGQTIEQGFSISGEIEIASFATGNYVVLIEKDGQTYSAKFNKN